MKQTGRLVSGADATGEPSSVHPLHLANRHGLIAGAMGTGKTASGNQTPVKAATSRNGVTDAPGDAAGRVFKGAMRQAAMQLGRQLVRGASGRFVGR